MGLPLKSRDACQLDLVGLGEAMIRLSPAGHGRIEFASSLEIWVGGGEYNCAYALARLGLRAGWASRLVDNPLGAIVLNHARAVGMDVSAVAVAPYDGVGRTDRIGLNFTEVGTAVRPSVTMYDRGHSAASHLVPGMIDFDTLLARRGVRWLHTGGIFPALSDGTAAVALEALKKARNAATVTSYDMNFRSTLWSLEKCRAVTETLMPHVDVVIGNEGHFQGILGISVDGLAAGQTAEDPALYQKLAEQVCTRYPGIKAIGTTRRTVKSGLVNDFSGLLYLDGRLYASRVYENLEIEDPVGGGDGFSAGLIYGLLQGLPAQECVELAAAHGALLHTTRGDTSQITLEELRHVAQGGSARIRR